MKINEILKKYKPLFDHEINKFSSMGIPKDEIESEINNLVLKVSKLNLDELSTGKYLKASIENNLRKLINRRERDKSINRKVKLFREPYRLEFLLEDIDSEKLDNLEKFIYILKKSGLKRKEMAKIVKKKESYVKFVLKNIKNRMEVKR